jgi:hypothetical protein
MLIKTSNGVAKRKQKNKHKNKKDNDNFSLLAKKLANKNVKLFKMFHKTIKFLLGIVSQVCVIVE